jgi:transposase
MQQKSQLEEAADELGVEVVFLPKFHCELNYIEYLWGYSKREVRASTDGKIATLEQLVHRSLRSCPLSTTRRWYTRMWKMVIRQRAVSCRALLCSTLFARRINRRA